MISYDDSNKIFDSNYVIGWTTVKENGKTPKLKDLTVIKFGENKLAKCKNGNVLLCGRDGCYNISRKKDSPCCSHKNDREAYLYCRSPTICTKYATYGHEETKQLFCLEHKGIDDFDVINPRCSEPGCKVRPSFGVKEKFCLVHKKKNMYDVMNPKCQDPSCDLRPNYNYEGLPPIFCVTHKEILMIDVCYKRCLYPDCYITATFALPGEKANSCATHKSDLMIDVYNIKCYYPECKTLASFGYEGGRRISCIEHIEKDMTSLVGKICIYPSCSVRASYVKLYDKKRIHCVEHASLNEYGKLKCNPKCLELSCNNIAYFVEKDDTNLYPVRCFDHQLPTDIQLVNKICEQCFDKIYMPSNKTICMECGKYRKKILFSFKEHIVKEFLRSNSISFRHNKAVHQIGSQYRPDFLIDTKFGKIILEVDEHQHKRQNKEINDNETNRMKVIYKDIQIVKKNSEVLFIRYNPDFYEGPQYDTDQRLTYLYKLLNYFLDINIFGIKLGVVYLYYDGFTLPPPILNLL